MKTANDPRHKKRAHIMKDLFAWNFQKINKQSFSTNKTELPETAEIIKQIDKIDSEIEKAATEWPIKQINKLDLAILRLAVFELIIKKDVPYKAIVDEAVELGKEYGNESSPGFINGVLGSIIRTNQLDKEK